MKAKFIPIVGALALSVFMVPLASAQDVDRGDKEGGRHHRVPVEEISTALGFSSVDEFKAAFDPETTNLHEYAESLGVDLKEVLPPRKGKGHGKLLEATGLTKDEIKARVDAGETIQDIATEYGIELPERPERKGKKKGHGKFLEETGLTKDEVKARIDGGETIQDIAAEYGIELPERPQHRSGGLGVQPGNLE